VKGFGLTTFSSGVRLVNFGATAPTFRMIPLFFEAVAYVCLCIGSHDDDDDTDADADADARAAGTVGQRRRGARNGADGQTRDASDLRDILCILVRCERTPVGVGGAHLQL